MTWLKNNWQFSLILAVLITAILVIVFKKNDDPSAYVKAQIDQLKTEMKDVILHEFDSLRNQVAAPITDNNAHADSLADIEHAENNKILYELRKKRNAVIDTLGSDELARIFAGYAEGR